MTTIVNTLALIAVFIVLQLAVLMMGGPHES